MKRAELKTLLHILNEKNEGKTCLIQEKFKQIRANLTVHTESSTIVNTPILKKNTPNLIHQIEVSILYSLVCEKIA